VWKRIDTKTLCVTILLASVAMALNPGVTGLQIMMPFSTLYFHFWEIPLIIAFILMGARCGAIVALINATFLFAYFPGPSQPYYAASSVAAAACTMMGTYVGLKVISIGHKEKELSTAKTVLILTFFVLLIRLPIMPIVLYGVLVFGYGMPQWWVVNVQLPLQALYNVILMSYTVPTAYLITKGLRKNLKFKDAKDTAYAIKG